MNNDLTCSCSCTPDSTPTDTSPDFLYAHQSPYPPVCIKEQNPLYGRMMLDNMGWTGVRNVHDWSLYLQQYFF